MDIYIGFEANPNATQTQPLKQALLYMEWVFNTD